MEFEEDFSLISLSGERADHNNFDLAQFLGGDLTSQQQADIEASEVAAVHGYTQVNKLINGNITPAPPVPWEHTAAGINSGEDNQSNTRLRNEQASLMIHEKNNGVEEVTNSPIMMTINTEHGLGQKFQEYLDWIHYVAVYGIDSEEEDLQDTAGSPLANSPESSSQIAAQWGRNSRSSSPDYVTMYTEQINTIDLDSLQQIVDEPRAKRLKTPEFSSPSSAGASHSQSPPRSSSPQTMPTIMSLNGHHSHSKNLPELQSPRTPSTPETSTLLNDDLYCYENLPELQSPRTPSASETSTLLNDDLYCYENLPELQSPTTRSASERRILLNESLNRIYDLPEHYPGSFNNLPESSSRSYEMLNRSPQEFSTTQSPPTSRSQSPPHDTIHPHTNEEPHHSSFEELPEPSGFQADSSSSPSMLCTLNGGDIAIFSSSSDSRPDNIYGDNNSQRRIMPKQSSVVSRKKIENVNLVTPSSEQAYMRAQTIVQNKQFMSTPMKSLHPRVLGYCHMLFNTKKSIREAWEITNKVHQMGKNTDFGAIAVPRWTPLMHVTEKLPKFYVRYFPCVLETHTMEILGLDPRKYVGSSSSDDNTRGPQDWICLPSLKYFPVRMERVIAAAAGLLAVDGGIQPIELEMRNNVNKDEWKKLQAPNNNYWEMPDYQDCKGQSILAVTNPLTQEYKLLPPIPHKILQDKVGAFVFTDASRTAYRLIILGWVTLKISQEAEDQHKALGSRFTPRPQKEVALVIYSSDHERWVHFDKVSNVHNAHVRLGGRTGCVVMNYGIYFGGLRVTPTPKQRQDFHTAVIIYFNCSKSRRQQLVLDFNVTGQFSITMSEPPKVVRAGDNKIYAIAREVAHIKATQVIRCFVTQVSLNADGSPNGSYEPAANGEMPKHIIDKLFLNGGSKLKRNNNNDDKKSIIQRGYDVQGGDRVLAFKVSLWDPDIALYHFDTGVWTMTAFPMEQIDTTAPKKNVRDWDLIEGTYEPMWLAIP
jgi:hypothetical protein